VQRIGKCTGGSGIYTTMATINLLVRNSLNGDTEHVDVEPDTSMSVLRAMFEESLPEFHSVKLTNGGHVLQSGCVDEAGLREGSEVQLTIFRDAEKAITQIKNFIHQSIESIGDSEDLWKALNFLGETGDLELAHSELLLKWGTCEAPVSEFVDTQSFVLLCGETFGRSCADPMPFIPRLLEISQAPDNYWTRCFVLAALFEMDAKDEDALRGYESDLTSALRPLDMCRWHWELMPQLGRLLGKFGIELESGAELNVEARNAFEQGRQQFLLTPKEQCASDPQDATAVLAAAGQDQEEDMTDQALDNALRESEADATQQEQAHLQEALLRSKADNQPLQCDSLADAASGSTSLTLAIATVVLLQYSQSKSWFPSALLEGPELQEERAALEAAGFCPTLPSGAKIFVAPDIYEAVKQHLDKGGSKLTTSHVVVAADLEDKVRTVVDTARQAATRRERGSCKLKFHAELTIFQSREEVSQTLAEEPLGRVVDVLVNRTFVHIPIPSSMRSASSIYPATV